ncbi:MAG: VanZ family protein [Anaerolineae bacterium]|nr:VanZ family protein [Anaerolineae bacterium]
MNIKRLAFFFALFILTIILLADLGFLRPVLFLVSRVDYLDKILHFLLIGTLTFLVSSALVEALPSLNPKWVLLSAVFILAVVFTLEEISQGPIRGRDASWADLAANYAGILVFGGLAWLRVRKRLQVVK